MPQSATLTDVRGLAPEQFTLGLAYDVSFDGRNTAYSFKGEPVELDCLAGTDMVRVLRDDQGQSCMICQSRFTFKYHGP